MPHASLVQLAEHALRKRMFVGSVPIVGSFAQRRRRHFTTAPVVFHQCVGVCVCGRVCVSGFQCVCVCVRVFVCVGVLEFLLLGRLV